MRIGLDARKLRDGGIGTYIRGLLGALAEAARGHEFVALLDPADQGSIVWPGTRVREVPVRAGKYGLAEHVVVPHAARRADVELLHAPHYTLPLGWRGPAVVTIHDLIHVRFPQFFPPGASLYARAMAGMAARRARLVLVDSSHTQGEVVELLRVPRAKVRVVPLGVSPVFARRAPDEIAACLQARSLPTGYLLYVGARKPHKNLPLLFEALARIRATERPPLVLSGAPWDADDPLARLAGQLGLGGTVHFAGDLRDERTLACVYSGATLYVQPALTEGFGLPPLEAMACGTPVLSSNGGALPESAGDAAELLPPRDPDAWAQTIAALLGNTVRREELVRRGLARSRAFTWERTAELTLAVYEEAAAR
jgi:glycosyltransferase involved in cell wall biosynthesis